MAKQIEGVMARKTGFSFISSAVFPFMGARAIDTRLIFLDYWKLKNSIEENSMIMEVRIHNEEGGQLAVVRLTELRISNEISIKQILRDQETNPNINGSIFVTIYSNKNLRIPFPALICCVDNPDGSLAYVHSAGRVKNAHEKSRVETLTETNFSSEWSDQRESFFHLFNGHIEDAYRGELEISLVDKFGHELATTTYAPPNKPFSSKQVFISDVFDINAKELLDEDWFIKVKVSNPSIYTRLICGIYDKERSRYELTHSFTETNDDDFIESKDLDEGMKYLSQILVPTGDDVSCKLRIFPTNNQSNVEYEIWKSSNDIVELEGTQVVNVGKGGGTTWDYEDGGENSIRSIKAIGEKTPTRVNTTYKFRIKGVSGETDIALAQKAHNFPKRQFLWGHGFLGEKIDTKLLIWTSACQGSNLIEEDAELTVYFRDSELKQKLPLSEFGCEIVNVKDLFIGVAFSDAEPISWTLEHEAMSSECFYLTYSEELDFIAGEHCF